jgi:3-oxoacyl-[acyl-carrier-protein] synthase III
MTLGANMIEAGQVDHVIVTSAESSSPLYASTFERLKATPTLGAFKESLASLTLGSAAAACLLRRASPGEACPRVRGWVSRLASQFHGLCWAEGHFAAPVMVTDSLRLMKEGVALAQRTWAAFLQEMECSPESFKHIITHQVSTSHHQKIFQALGLDPALGRQESSWLGNTGTVAVPMSLALAVEEQRLHKGDQIALLGIGSGLSSLMMGIEW